MIAIRPILTALCLTGLAVGAGAADELEPAQRDKPRVVSLDFCADQYVLALADRDQILGVSVQAGDAHSALRNRADGLPRVRDAAEDVLAFQPDLIVRSFGGDARARAFYARLGLEVFDLGFASDMDGVEAMIARTAHALGQRERGEALIADLRRDLNAARAAGPAERALYLTPSGATAGSQTLIHSWLEAAGFENASAPRQGWTSLDLEHLIEEAPDRILTAFFDGSAARDSWSPSRHGVFEGLLASVPRVDLDGADMACPSWRLGAAARRARGLELTAQASALAPEPGP